MLNHWILLKRWLLVKKNSLFSVDDPLGLKLLTFLRLVFCHLKEHKFRDGFKDTLNSLCFCGAKVETTVHFLSHCQLYSTQRSELFDNIGKLINSFLNVNKKPQALVLLYGLKRNNSENLNQNIINAVIKYLKSAASFESIIFDENQETLCFFC